MTRALILAAGEGARLRPLTNDMPKCMVELCGQSLLTRQVRTLNTCGITDIHIATGYLKEKIETQGFNTSFNPRYYCTNMVESLFAAREFVSQNDDLILSYGDIVYEPSNLKTLLACDSEIAVMIDRNWRKLWEMRMENPLEDAETLLLDDDDFITELGKNPNSYDVIQGQYTGLIKLSGDKVNDFIRFYDELERDAIYDGKDFDNMYMTSFIQLLIDNDWKVKASIVESGWLEVDSVEDLTTYETMQSQGTLKKFYSI